MKTNSNTINADETLGGSEGTLLANRYRVVRPLGQGGMGSVWLAADKQLDNREVAIKMLPSILVSNRRAYTQLKAEALVSLKLTHPNIAAVRAFEENDGNPFLVVDYIDGQTLDDYLVEKCDAGRARAPREPQPAGLPESEVLRLLAPIAAALDYAHSKGVVHRDVKPGNVMIAKDGTPYILDFGIAREIQETMTRVTGKLSSGTLMYMSPEQLHGAAPKSSQDVYSFAAMAYECLMGTPPFSRGQIEYQIEHDSPAPLGPHFIKCGLGVMAGLAKSPEDRPENCAAVLTTVEAASVRPSKDDGMTQSNDGRARAPREPRRRLAAMASLVAIAAVCGAGYVWYQGQQDALSRQAKIARLAEEKKALEAEKAEAAAKRAREEKAATEAAAKRAREEKAATEAAQKEKEKIEAEKARVAEEKARAVTDQKNRREADALKEAERAASFDPKNLEASNLKADIQVKIDELARVAREKKEAEERKQREAEQAAIKQRQMLVANCKEKSIEHGTKKCEGDRTVIKVANNKAQAFNGNSCGKSITNDVDCSWQNDLSEAIQTNAAVVLCQFLIDDVDRKFSNGLVVRVSDEDELERAIENLREDWTTILVEGGNYGLLSWQKNLKRSVRIIGDVNDRPVLKGSWGAKHFTTVCFRNVDLVEEKLIGTEIFQFGPMLEYLILDNVNVERMDITGNTASTLVFRECTFQGSCEYRAAVDASSIIAIDSSFINTTRNQPVFRLTGLCFLDNVSIPTGFGDVFKTNHGDVGFQLDGAYVWFNNLNMANVPTGFSLKPFITNEAIKNMNRKTHVIGRGGSFLAVDGYDLVSSIDPRLIDDIGNRSLVVEVQQMHLSGGATMFSSYQQTNTVEFSDNELWRRPAFPVKIDKHTFQELNCRAEKYRSKRSDRQEKGILRKIFGF